LNVAQLTDPTLFYALAVLAVLLAGFSKASAAGGVGLMAVPLMSIAIAPQHAAAIMLPILCALDLLGLWAWRGQYDLRLLRQLVPGAILGIIIGALVFKAVDVRWVKGLLGAECLVFALHRIAGSRHFGAAAAREPEPPPIEPSGFRFEPPTVATRDAMWELAGPSRDEASLRKLVGDPYPLAAMIGSSALERHESRGSHRRSDHPLPDPALDGMHLVVAPDRSIRRRAWG